MPGTGARKRARIGILDNVGAVAGWWTRGSCSVLEQGLSSTGGWKLGLKRSTGVGLRLSLGAGA